MGAGPDLVDDEKNGFVVPVEHVAMLADRLRCLTDNLELAIKMDEQSRQRISKWNFIGRPSGSLTGITHCGWLTR